MCRRPIGGEGGKLKGRGDESCFHTLAVVGCGGLSSSEGEESGKEKEGRGERK